VIKKNINIVLNLTLIIGVAVYILLTTTTNLSNAIIWTIFILYSWVFTSLYFDKFNFQKLITTCCYAVFLFSITYFLSFGLEEMPYPEGAIMFYPKHVAVSLLLLFISTIPLLYKMTENQKAVLDQKVTPAPKQEKQNINEKWEEATLEDLESGKYEPF